MTPSAGRPRWRVNQTGPSAVRGRVRTPASISIVVPIKVGAVEQLRGLAECYGDLLGADADVELIVADESPTEVFDWLDARLSGLPRATHFRPDGRLGRGTNGKLNNVRAAIPHCSGAFVLIVDDDYRPTPGAIARLRAVLRPGSVVRAITSLSEPWLGDRVERGGMLMGLALARDYFCGHLAFDRSLAGPGFPRADGLFDELAMARELVALGARDVIVMEPWFPILPSSRHKFLQQRIRYAYEHLQNVPRAALFLGVVPVLGGLLLVSPAAAAAFAAAITLGTALLALVGQRRYPSLAPPFTWLLAPVYFWFLPFAIWPALALYVTGGMPFGGTRVKRPA